MHSEALLPQEKKSANGIPDGVVRTFENEKKGLTTYEQQHLSALGQILFTASKCAWAHAEGKAG